MEPSLVLVNLQEKIPQEALFLLKDRFDKMEPSKVDQFLFVELKDPLQIFLVSFLLGYFGVDRFLLGQVGLGVGKFLTCGGLGIWYLVDLLLIMNATKQRNWERLRTLLQMCLWKMLTGFPCLACGLTRSFLSLLSGDWKGMLDFHPLFPLAIFGLGLFAMDTFRVRKMRANEAWTICVFFIVVYALRFVLFFPEKEPMTFASHSFLPSFYQWLLP